MEKRKKEREKRGSVILNDNDRVRDIRQLDWRKRKCRPEGDDDDDDLIVTKAFVRGLCRNAEEHVNDIKLRI